MTREVRTDPEVLQHACHDAINLFVREVLIPRGLVDKDRYYREQKVLLPLQVDVTRTCAKAWTVCHINDEV